MPLVEPMKIAAQVAGVELDKHCLSGLCTQSIVDGLVAIDELQVENHSNGMYRRLRYQRIVLVLALI